MDDWSVYFEFGMDDCVYDFGCCDWILWCLIYDVVVGDVGGYVDEVGVGG